MKEQRLRHIKDEERRKVEQEKMEAMRASQANRKVFDLSVSFLLKPSQTNGQIGFLR